jgi:orotate phosphoribosyltransferase
MKEIKGKETLEKEFLAFMEEAGAVKYGDFITKSGRKTSYFVNTGSYQTGEQIMRLGEFYARCIAGHMEAGNISPEVNCLFGPAYKGIPLVTTTAVALYRNHGINLSTCFNRKEEKDHGEGGSLVGHQLKDGDRVLIIEDVITAGTAVRETLPLLRSFGDIRIDGLVVSVDRMEKGQGEKSATQELMEEFGIPTYSIINAKSISRSANWQVSSI